MEGLRSLPSIDVVSPLDGTFSSKRSFVIYYTVEGGISALDPTNLFLRIPIVNQNSPDWYKKSTFLEVKGTIVPSRENNTYSVKSVEFTLKAFISTLTIGEEVDFSQRARIDSTFECEIFDDDENFFTNTSIITDPTNEGFPVYYNPYFKSLDVFGSFTQYLGLVIKGTYLLI